MASPPAALLDRPTPYLLVDEPVLATNLTAMAVLARDRGLALRPHAKTHKSPDLARLQVASGAVGLTVATVAEAEVFSRAGFTDLFVAYPLWVDGPKGTRLRALAERARVSVGVDSVTAGRAVAAHAPGSSVLVEVDSGQHRSGIAPEAAGALAEVCDRSGLDVAGVFTFPGHSYAPGRAAEVAAEESAALREAAASMTAHGLVPRVVSGGSTPSATDADGDVLTEMRPGNYVFADAQQWELGVVAPERIALACVATVVSHGSGHLVLDAGSKVLGADRPDWATGFGRLLDHPGARIASLSEHHAVVVWDDGPMPALGSRVRVAPNHSCSAVNLADELVLSSGGCWPVSARGANT